MSNINFLTQAQRATLDSDTLATIESAALRHGYTADDMPADPGNGPGADLTTTAGKIAYIQEHGSDAFVKALAELRGDDGGKVTDGSYSAWKARQTQAKPEPTPEPKQDKGLNWM